MAERSTAIVQTEVDTERLGLITWMGVARDRFGKGFLSQVYAMWRLSRVRGRLAPFEYFMYHLFDDQRHSPEAKRTFAGAAIRGQLRTELLPDPWKMLGDDKPTISGLLRAHGLPVPETQAVYHRFRTIPDARPLRTPEDLASFLQSEARYPLFAKPALAQNGLGAVSIDRCDGEHLVLQDGRTVGLDAFIHALEPYAAVGTLFQTRLAPHPAVAAVVGEGRIASVRLLVLIPEGGTPRVHRAVWAVPTGNHPTDNFWRVGNLLGAVDPESGALGHVTQGDVGTYDRSMFHPDTGAAFHGLTLPDWDAVRDLALRAAAIFPALPIQGWDIALTDAGPRILELEPDGGEPWKYQLPHERGLLTGAYADVLDALERRQADRAAQARQVRKDLARLAVDDAKPKPSEEG